MYPTNYSTPNNLPQMEYFVKQSIHYESKGSIIELKNSLFQLFRLISKPGTGKNILHYKDKDELALCFAFMLQYDWIQDPDIREVWAENGFYCIISYWHQASNAPYAMLILFILLCVGRESLKPKVQDILNTSRVYGPRFHFNTEDYRLGAQHVIDQFARFAVMGIKYSYLYDDFHKTEKLLAKYNGIQYFTEILKRKDLEKYDLMEYDDVIFKADVVKDNIGSILMDY